MAPPKTAALPALASHLVLTSAATNDDTIAEPPEEKQEPLWKKFGEAGVIAYVGINVFWYAIGVNLFLRGMPIKHSGGARLANLRRRRDIAELRDGLVEEVGQLRVELTLVRGQLQMIGPQSKGRL